MWARSRRLTTALVAVAVLAAGCGSGEGAPSDDLSPAAFIGSISSAQSKAVSAHMTIKATFQGQEVTGEGDLAGPQEATSLDDVSMAMTMKGPDGKQFEMRLVDAVMYMNLGSDTDDKFVKIDLHDESNPIGKAYSQMLDQMDPGKQMKQVQKAIVSYRKKGEAVTLDGVKAQPYEIVIDPSKLPTPDVEGAQPPMPKRMRMTIFVGSDQLPRRMVMKVSGVTTTVDYSKWGEDVSIEKPKDSEISDEDPFAQPS